MMTPLRVRIVKHTLPQAVQVMDVGDLVHPNGYISQEVYEYARELGLDYKDAEYMVYLYNEDLLFWGTGYYAEMRGIPYDVWKKLCERFEVNE